MKIQMETLIAWVLRLGVVCSTLLLAAGFITLYISQNPEAAALGNWLLVLGIFVLFATPILRVLMSIFSFAVEKNWRYVLITFIVFVDIMLAIFVVPQLLHI